MFPSTSDLHCKGGWRLSAKGGSYFYGCWLHIARRNNNIVDRMITLHIALIVAGSASGKDSSLKSGTSQQYDLKENYSFSKNSNTTGNIMATENSHKNKFLLCPLFSCHRRGTMPSTIENKGDATGGGRMLLAHNYRSSTIIYFTPCIDLYPYSLSFQFLLP